jgi:putative membrane protein
MGSESSRTRTALTMGVGLVLLALLLYHAGLDAVWHRLRVLGWWSPLILLPYVGIAVCDTIAWRGTLPVDAQRRIPFLTLYLVRMAGEAVNSVTPTAAVGGEPVKAYMLRPWGVPGGEGMASVVIAKTALTAAQSLFTALGVAALLEDLGRPHLALGWLVVLLAGTAGFTLSLVWVQRRNPATMVWRWLRRVVPRWQVVARLESAVATLDQRLADFYHVESGSFFKAASWNFVGWLGGVVETQVMLTLIGHPISWLDALVIEALAQPIRAAAIIIPGGLGTQELGGVWLCTFLGMPEPVAVTLWLLKRAREVTFDGLGLLYLARKTAGKTLKAT